MQDKLENFIKQVYRKWKSGRKTENAHPDEEALACFLEGRLDKAEAEEIKKHLISCRDCLEAFSLNLKMDVAEAQDVPPELIKRAKDLLSSGEGVSLLEIILKVKDKALEILNTSGDVLVGQELVPAPVLRSRSIGNFKDEVTILKDFKDIRVEVKIDKKGRETFNVTIMAKDKLTQKILKDLRVTLIKDELELESCIADSGSVVFEHILLGKYTVEISTLDNKLASILLEIKT